MLNRNADVFSKHKADIGCCNFVEHEIEIEEGSVPHREGARRMTPNKSEACRKEIEMLMEYDMIEPSKSPWACGVVMAKRKGGQLRFCCHFRYLNAVTIKDAYPIPRIDESLSKLGDAKFFTTLDLGSAFWQVPLRKQDREKTGFACEVGLFQWKRMPFGLCNAMATFQRLMAQALTSVTQKYGNLIMCYVDDVVIATPTLEDHIERLEEVFSCMKQAGLKCKPSKCEILRDSIKYLGRLVDKHGVRPDPEAVEAVLTWKAPKTDTQLMSFLRLANYYREFIKGYADKIYPMQRLMRNKGKKFTWTDEAQVSFENIKRELFERPVLGMPTEKEMFVLDTDASVVAISGILHQEQEWNGRTVLRPIAYGSKVLSDPEMKYGAPKAEMFAVITFVEKYRAYLGSAPFKLRVDNRALAWLKTYSMDQSYIGRWIVRLDGYHMIIEHRTRDKHQNADSLSKKTEFYERLEEKQANQSEIKDGFSFLDKETYDKLPLTRWLDKSGHPIPGHPNLPVETAAEIKLLARDEPVPLDLLIRSNLVQQELTRLGINSMALLNRTVNVAPDVMGKLRDLLDREVDRHDREWMETMQRLTVTERTEKRPVPIRSRGVERDCRSIVNQLVSSMPKEVLLRTSFTEYGTLNQNQTTEEVRIRSKSSFTRRVHFTDAKEEYEPSPDCSSVDETMSGESDTFEPVKDDSSEESDTFEPVQDDLSGERLTRPPRGRIFSGESGSKRPMDRFLSGESRNISDNLEYDVQESVDSSVDSRPQSWDKTSETTSNSDMSEIAIHSLLVDWKQRGLDRETHQDPDRDRYTSDEEGTVVDNAADELELIAVSKRPTRLLPHGTVVRTSLEPSVQEATPLKKIWCVSETMWTRQCPGSLIPSSQSRTTRLGINSMALLNRTVNVAPDVMGKLRDLLDREVDRHDREWMETMQRLTVTERTEKRPVSIRSRGVERDCRSIVNQLVSSMPKEVLLRTSFTEYGTLNQNQTTEEVRIRSKSSFTRRVHFTDAKEEYEPSPDCSSVDETMSGESDTFEPVKDDSSEESDTFEPVQDDLSGERLTRPPRGRILSGESGSKRPMDRFLSGESRNISDNLEYDVQESVDSSVDSRPQSWDKTSETTSNSDMSEIAIHSLLVDWKQRGLDRETHQDPDRDRYTSDEEGTVVDNAADELELIAVSKRPTRLLPHGTVVRTNLEPSVQEATPLKKIWCVKLMDDAHAPEIMSGQRNVVKTYLKARYRLSDLLRAQRNDRMTSSLKRWIENGAPDKGDLEEDSYKILKQFYLKRNDLVYLNKDGIVACKRKEEDKVLYKYNSIVLPQLYQTELLFRSHDQMGHQGVDKVYNRIQKRFEWPGLKKACEKWIAACLSCQQAKDPRKLRFPLQSIESSGFNEVVQIDHQKICMTATGYNQVLVMIDHFTKYAEAAPCMTASAEETCDHLINVWIARHVERQLVSMLRVYCPRYMDDWDKHLPQVMGAYNSTEHSTTGISPHMMLTGHEKTLPLRFFYPQYEGKRTAPQTYVRDVIRRQQDLNDLCRRNTQQAQIRQKRRFDKRTADAKAYSVGDYVWVFQEVVPPKGTKKLLKKWRGPFQITEVHQGGRFYRLCTGRAAHYENIKPHNASSEDWCIPADMQEGDYLKVDRACEVNERGTRDKNDGNEVVDDCDLPLDLELTERVEVDDETLPYAKEDWDCPEQTEIDKGIQPDFPLTMETRQSKRGKTRRNTIRTARTSL